jgi:phage-related protein
LPHSHAFGDGLFELRPRGQSGIGRALVGHWSGIGRALVGHWSGILFFLMGKKIVVLHAFIKKSQQTPDNELKMARKRLKEVMHD